MSILLPERIPTVLTETAKRTVNHIAFSSDGRRRALGHVGMTAEVWQDDHLLYRGEFYSRNERVRPTQRVRGVALTPDGSVLYVAAGDRAQALSVVDGRTLWDYVPPRSFGFLVISPIALAASPLGGIALAFDNGTFGIWSADGERRFLLRENESPRYLGFLDGERVVGSDSFSLCVWHTHTKERLLKVPLPDRAYALAIAPNDPVVATRGLEATLLWNAEDGMLLGRVPSGIGLPVVAIHPHAREVALGDGNGVSVVDFGGRFIRRHEAGAPISTAAYTPDGTGLLAGCGDGEVRRWDVA